jgi:lipoprotein-anchoring transpeptidase ErfK/SrfK
MSVFASHNRFNRRKVLQAAGASALGMDAADAGVRSAAAGPTPAYTLADVALPPDMGQTSLHVFVSATGHTLRGTMLDYWRANGGAAVYGNPISEPFASSDGYYSQAFERAIFQYRPEYLDTEDPTIRLMPIGALALDHRLGQSSRDHRRAAGGGDRAVKTWTPLDPNGKTASAAMAASGIFDATTGHTVTDDFLTWYTGHEGGFYLGRPLSQQHQERGATVQYFDGGLLVRADGGFVRLASLASEIAPQLGFETERVTQGDLPKYDESLFWTAANPNPVGDPSTPGRRWVEVSLDSQQLWAYQDVAVVHTTLVSTGLAPNVTLPGLFHIRLKYPSQTMQGFTNSTGEVAGFGATAPSSTAVPWTVKDVPNVMYFSLSAEALHGTYWHHNFGNPMSHGCVNLPLEVAAWMYGWAPLGTMVWIHK